MAPEGHDNLATYLRDHLAGSASALELLEHLQEDHEGTGPGRLAAELRGDVADDRRTLEQFAERLGVQPSALREAAAWVGEKASRLRLGGDAGGELGVLRSLEVLELGILGKRALWLTLARLAESDPRIATLDYPRLIARAESQQARVQEARLAAAERAFAGGAP